MKYITRTVWILSWISLFTDTASEMLYPIMPIYLKSIGFSIVLIGILEGVAEATAGLSKGYFGKLSDVSGRRVPFVQIGYAFSAISKPMMAIFIFPLWIFFARTIDRFGKGIRTGARDAILSDEATPSTKGKVFGFHRSMDTFGAVFGPSLALLYLYFYPQDYKTLFFIAFIPGVLAVLTSFYLKDKKGNEHKINVKTPFFSFLKYWKTSPKAYRKVVIGLLIFTLFNSSDVFLLLQAKQSGLGDTMVIGVYIFYNLIYALFAFPIGILADKVGLKTIFIIGLALFATVYFGMSVNTNLYVFFGLFFLYGIYASATEGISKAWISNITDKKDTATAIGTFSGLQSICTMLASSLTGLIWFQFGATTAFMTTAIATIFVMAYFLMIPKPVAEIKNNIAFMTLQEWLLKICNTEKPDKSIIAYNFGLFETEEGYTVYLSGSMEYDEMDSGWAANNAFEPKHKYYPLPRDEYKGLKWEEVLEKIQTQLKDFTKTDGFIKSFFAKAKAVTTGFDDGDLVQIK